MKKLIAIIACMIALIALCAIGASILLLSFGLGTLGSLFSCHPGI